jgi:hypothetical protein
MAKHRSHCKRWLREVERAKNVCPLTSNPNVTLPRWRVSIRRSVVTMTVYNDGKPDELETLMSGLGRGMVKHVRCEP